MFIVFIADDTRIATPTTVNMDPSLKAPRYTVRHPKTTSDGVNSIWHANKKTKLITLLHRYIRVVLCVGAAVFGGQAGFGHHG
jgi:hypothetical protein